MENLTLEQKVILHLAKKGYLTNAGDVQRALKEFEYAGKMVTGNVTPGLEDDIKEEVNAGNIEVCDHKALTNDEIQEVFDNDEEESSK